MLVKSGTVFYGIKAASEARMTLIRAVLGYSPSRAAALSFQIEPSST